MIWCETLLISFRGEEFQSCANRPFHPTRPQSEDILMRHTQLAPWSSSNALAQPFTTAFLSLICFFLFFLPLIRPFYISSVWVLMADERARVTVSLVSGTIQCNTMLFEDPSREHHPDYLHSGHKTREPCYPFFSGSPIHRTTMARSMTI